MLKDYQKLMEEIAHCVIPLAGQYIWIEIRGDVARGLDLYPQLERYKSFVDQFADHRKLVLTEFAEKNTPTIKVNMDKACRELFASAALWGMCAAYIEGPYDYEFFNDLYSHIEYKFDVVNRLDLVHVEYAPFYERCVPVGTGNPFHAHMVTMMRLKAIGDS